MSARGPSGEAALARGRRDRGDASDRWATPRPVLSDAAAIIGVASWSIDLAAAPGSAVAPTWLGPEAIEPRARDALALDAATRDKLATWTGSADAAWLNPPYARAAAFVALAADLGRRGLKVGVLVFARTDTAWWHDRVVPHATRIALRRGRIAFVDPLTGAPGQSAPAPSALLGFGPPGPFAPPAGVTAALNGDWWILR